MNDALFFLKTLKALPLVALWLTAAGCAEAQERPEQTVSTIESDKKACLLNDAFFESKAEEILNEYLQVTHQEKVYGIRKTADGARIHTTDIRPINGQSPKKMDKEILLNILDIWHAIEALRAEIKEHKSITNEDAIICVMAKAMDLLDKMETDISINYPGLIPGWNDKKACIVGCYI